MKKKKKIYTGKIIMNCDSPGDDTIGKKNNPNTVKTSQRNTDPNWEWAFVQLNLRKRLNDIGVFFIQTAQKK